MDMPNPQTTDEQMMRRCFALAMESAKHGEYPYGSVIVCNGKIVAETTNRVAHDRDVTRHAEVVAISAAQKATDSTSLEDCTLYTNMEPCAFCSYAIRESRIARVVFATRSPIMGGMSRWNILGDRKLSETLPEVFAPPPDVVPDFLAEEAEVTLLQSAPFMWAFVREGGVLDARLQRLAGSEQAGKDVETKYAGVAGAKDRLMRFLRRNFFDRFGRGETTSGRS
jgi:tRNA(adenine34) deaminase